MGAGGGGYRTVSHRVGNKHYNTRGGGGGVVEGELWNDSSGSGAVQ